MLNAPAGLALVAHVAMLSLISFGGIPTVIPDLRHFVVEAHGWMSDREFASLFGVIQTLPGPGMVAMTGLIGWKIAGVPGAAAAAAATFGPSCTVCFVAYRYWHRFREHRVLWLIRRGLAPVTLGLVIAGGTVIATTGHAGWPALSLTAGGIALVLGTRWSPLWALAAGAALGALGLV